MIAGVVIICVIVSVVFLIAITGHTFTDWCNSSPGLVIVTLAGGRTYQLVAILTGVGSNTIQQVV